MNFKVRVMMPFGKYKGDAIEDLPKAYIVWCLENIESLDEQIKAEMEKQLTLSRGEGVVRKVWEE